MIGCPRCRGTGWLCECGAAWPCRCGAPGMPCGCSPLRRAELLPERTGWPPGMLQDDDPGLSKWLASRPGARRQAREVVAEIARQRTERGTMPAPQPPDPDTIKT